LVIIQDHSLTWALSRFDVQRLNTGPSFRSPLPQSAHGILPKLGQVCVVRIKATRPFRRLTPNAPLSLALFPRATAGVRVLLASSSKLLAPPIKAAGSDPLPP